MAAKKETLVVKSVEELLKIHNDGGFYSELDIQQLKYASKKVTVDYVDVDCDDDEQPVIFLKEDGADRQWDPEMFTSLPKEIIEMRELTFHLDKELDGNGTVHFEKNGNFEVGCTYVNFFQLESLYKKAVELRTKYIPKPRKRKKASRKKSK